MVASDVVLASSFFVLMIALLGIFLRRRSLIHMLISVELILMSVNLNLIYFWETLHRVSAGILILFVMGLAAVEVAVGLALIMRCFQSNSTISLESLSLLKE